MNSPRLYGFAFVLASAISLTACGGLEPGDIGRGETASLDRGCFACHQYDYGGSLDPLPDPYSMHADTIAYASNITPDPVTGVGNWTDEQLDKAIRDGIDAADVKMCEPMPVYRDMGDQEVADIIAYLRSIPPIVRQVQESSCPSQDGDPHEQ
jgi:mono/diheme cytochrome c family protein